MVFRGGDIPVEIQPFEGVETSHQKLRDDLAQMFKRLLKEGRVSSEDDSVGWEEAIKPILRVYMRVAERLIGLHVNGVYHGNLWESMSIDENDEAIKSPTTFQKPNENDGIYDNLPALQDKDFEDLYEMLNEIMHPQGSNFKYQGPTEEWLSSGRDALLKSESYWSRLIHIHFLSTHPYLATGEARIKLMVGVNTFREEQYKSFELDKFEPAFKMHYGSAKKWKNLVLSDSAIAEALSYIQPAKEAKTISYNRPSDPVRIWRNVHEHKTDYFPEHEWSLSEDALANKISEGLPDIELNAWKTVRTLLTEGYLERDGRKILLGKVGWWDSKQPLPEWMEKALETVNEEARLRGAPEQAQRSGAQPAEGRGRAGHDIAGPIRKRTRLDLSV